VGSFFIFWHYFLVGLADVVDCSRQQFHHCVAPRELLRQLVGLADVVDCSRQQFHHCVAPRELLRQLMWLADVVD